MSDSKIIFITGASSGLGRTTAEYLAERGDYIFAGVRKNADIEALSKIENISPIKVDITSLPQVDRAIQEIKQAQRGLDVLVNNAGIAIGGPLVELEEGQLEQQFEVNVFGMWRVTKAAFPLLMESKKSPRIVNISSTAGRHALPFFGPYAMSKYAVEAFSDSLRRELDPLGIKVSIIQPGKFKTPIWQKGKKELEKFEKSLFKERAYGLVQKSLEKGMTKGQDPKIVAESVFKAIHSKRPKIRYHLPTGHFRSFLLDKIPARWTDWLVRKA